jgi:CRISPR-associated protein Csa1
MYLIPDEVRRRLLRRYRRRSREIVVDDRFRGWAWEIPPLDPPYDIQLSLSELTGRYCESMRDLYLAHVEKKRKPTNAKMIEGGLYHKIIASVIENAKQTLYCRGKRSTEALGKELYDIRDDIIETMIKNVRRPEVEGRGSELNLEQCKNNMRWLWDFEANQIIATLERVLTAQPYIGLDSLVNNAIPVVVEQKLDGRYLGLSGYLSADAFGSEGVVLDTKTGQRRNFHRLATTGYALVIESIYEYPVDIGCIAYCWFRKPVPPTIEYDVHHIDESLRQDFVELRDSAMKLIFDERDPGLPAKCYEDCSYWNLCH